MKILQFADDTDIVGKVCWKNLWCIKTIFRGFEILSGLKVNFHKSKVMGINVNESFMVAASQLLCCSREKLPFKFFGNSSGLKYKKRIIMGGGTEQPEAKIVTVEIKNIVHRW